MKRRTAIILLILGVAGFILGLVHLFGLRFRTGDIYPEYSTLRADPLGAKALYESLGHLVSVKRNYEPWTKLHLGPATTLFILGLKRDAFKLSEGEFKALEGFLVTGGRLVIALYPTYGRPVTNRFGPLMERVTRNQPRRNAGNDPRSEQKRNLKADKDGEGELLVDLNEKWGVRFDYSMLERDENQVYQPVRAELKGSMPLPGAVLWRSALYFDAFDPAWETIYASAQNAVLIERKVGGGKVLLASDSFLLSNEALRTERHPDLLGWLVGPAREVVFDETHLGVRQRLGIMALSLRYRLHGLWAGLLLLAILFVWKNSSSFLPQYQPADFHGRPVAGRESAAGFVNLLRRNIASGEIVNLCVAEWKKSCGQTQAAAEQLQRIESVLREQEKRPPRLRHPVQTYQLISRALAIMKPASKR